LTHSNGTAHLCDIKNKLGDGSSEKVSIAYFLNENNVILKIVFLFKPFCDVKKIQFHLFKKFLM
jgi:hypothetical protein